jgi:hypothetical protein
MIFTKFQIPNQDISFAQPDTGEGCGQIYAKNQQQRTIQKK